MKKFCLVTVLCVILSGCNLFKNEDIPEPKNVKALIVGVENGAFGKCTGSLRDTIIMQNILDKSGITNLTVLTDETATIKNVKNSLSQMLDAELLVFYYSGHGGSTPANLTNNFEVDGKDEFLCLYDGALIDDDIWSIICQAKNKVFLIFDCCHSETMFRNPGMTFSNIKQTNAFKSNANTFSMICWSGCTDDTYSYGSVYGGMFTRTIYSYFRINRTYDVIWDLVSHDVYLSDGQTCKQTKLGTDFGGNYIFR